MKYKVYLNEEAPVPAATKRRWTQNIIVSQMEQESDRW